jgi:hypothetical protein
MGHDRNEWPQGTHVAKWPHGIHANLFSSVKQRTQGLDGVESAVWSWSLVFVVVGLIVFVSPWFAVAVDLGSLEDEDDVDSFVDCRDVIISISFVLGKIGICSLLRLSKKQKK